MRKLRTFHRGAVVIVDVDDPLMEEVSTDLRDTVEDLFTSGNSHVVFDLGAVPFIDSPGLETLVDLGSRAREAGGGFCLASPNTVCRDILRATRLDEAILTFPTLEEAWEFVREGKIPAATHVNLKYVNSHLRYENGLQREVSLMLADPQTAGGLLIAVGPDKTERLITRLKEMKTPAASHIGRISEKQDNRILVYP